MLKVLIPLLILSIVGWVYQDVYLRPCARPISYHIGTIDTRFGLDKGDFVSALEEAEVIWESKIGINLFEHKPEGGKLPVNLIYDYRQETTNELVEIEGELEHTEASYESLEQDYSVLKRRHAELETLYQSRLATFNQHNTQYEESVDKWNRGRRTDKSEFTALERERVALESDFNEIKEIESELNRVVREINLTVDRMNTLARELNLNVETYNTLGASRGETFTGGLYTSDRSGERIDVFEFESHIKLVRILAHEFGHVLGLDHLDDREAIMYYLNEGSVGELSQEDLESLKALCRVE